MTFKKKKKKSVIAKHDEKTIKERPETPRRKNNVFLQIKESPIKIARPKTGRSRSHTTIMKKSSLTPTSSGDPPQDGQSSSAATLTPESNIVKDGKRNRSLSAPPPLSEQAKHDDDNSKPPEIRINAKDVVKVVVPTTTNSDQSPK